MLNGCRKYNLLFLPLVILVLLFFAPKEANARSVKNYFVSPKAIVPAFNLISSPRIFSANITSAGYVKTSIDDNFRKPQLKYRKKYKRWSSTTLVIKVPVKEIDPLSFLTLEKNCYETPIFLSHLHSFLFRLTPF